MAYRLLLLGAYAVVCFSDGNRLNKLTIALLLKMFMFCCMATIKIPSTYVKLERLLRSE